MQKKKKIVFQKSTFSLKT